MPGKESLRSDLVKRDRRQRYGRSGGGGKSTGIAREATEDGFASWSLDEMEDGQGEQNQDGVGEPRIQSDEVKALGFQYVTLDLQGFRSGSMNERPMR